MPRPHSRDTRAPTPDERERREPGRTRTAQGETQQPVPDQPFERDESVEPGGQAAPSGPHIGHLAQADAERGVPDTTRATEMDATYHRLRQEAEAPPAREARERPPGEVRPSRGPRASRR